MKKKHIGFIYSFVYKLLLSSLLEFGKEITYLLFTLHSHLIKKN